MPRKTIPIIVRLWTRVECRPDGCWVWKGPVNANGYGIIGKGGRSSGMLLVHRVAWEMLRGPVGPLNVLHRCDNPPCCNPDHLFVGTQRDNMADMWAKGRGKTNPSRGSGSENAKLTEASVRDIRSAHSKGVAGSVLAVQYGVSTTTVWNVIYRRTWKHIA